MGTMAISFVAAPFVSVCTPPIVVAVVVVVDGVDGVAGVAGVAGVVPMDEFFSSFNCSNTLIFLFN